MPVGKNSLARAAKQVSDQKKVSTPKKPKTDVEALPIEVLSEQVPSEETSRPAVSSVPDMPFVGNPLPDLDTEDGDISRTEAASYEAPDRYPIGSDMPHYLL